MKKLSLFLCAALLMIAAAGCSEKEQAVSQTESVTSSAVTESKTEQDITSSAVTESEQLSDIESAAEVSPELFYFGHASMCIVTGGDNVIYIDPFADGDYSRAADLILVTHGHYDHNGLELIESRNDGCEVITQSEALQGGEYKTFEYPFVTVEAVEAGNNPNHDINECVGYVLTFENGKSVYVSGDTSTTDQMSELGDRSIDYAFFCCDGVYNMDITEAAECAEAVGAKHNIPYHNETADTEYMFDKELAERFDAPNKMIVYPGESFTVE